MAVVNPVAIDPPIAGLIFGFHRIVADMRERVVGDDDVVVDLTERRFLVGEEMDAIEGVGDKIVGDPEPAVDIDGSQEVAIQLLAGPRRHMNVFPQYALPDLRVLRPCAMADEHITGLLAAAKEGESSAMEIESAEVEMLAVLHIDRRGPGILDRKVVDNDPAGILDLQEGGTVEFRMIVRRPEGHASTIERHTAIAFQNDGLIPASRFLVEHCRLVIDSGQQPDRRAGLGLVDRLLQTKRWLRVAVNLAVAAPRRDPYNFAHRSPPGSAPECDPAPIGRNARRG